MRRLVLLAVGAALLLPLLAVDPAAVVLLLDADLVAMTATVAFALVGGNLRIGLRRLATSHFAASCRAGAALSRTRPRTLLEP